MKDSCPDNNLQSMTDTQKTEYLHRMLRKREQAQRALRRQQRWSMFEQIEKTLKLQNPEK